MPQTDTAPAVLPHATFLQRLDSGSGPDIRLGQAAFLVMRLVDLLAPDGKPVHPDAFRYQLTATDRYCAELTAEGVEAAHLHGIVRTAAEAHRLGDSQLLAPGLLAYAHYLEDEGHYEEALDVLWSVRHVIGSQLRAADGVAAVLRTARLNRKLARFDEAEAAYEEAEQLAAAAGDAYSVFLSRHGRANALHGRGNLAGAEASYRALVTDARAAGHRQAEALAEHGLGTTLDSRGQPAEGIPHVWRGFELYQDEASRMRALGDLGLMLLAIGDAAGAHRALSVVVQRATQADIVLNAMIELMHCESYRRDRLGFERLRGQCEDCITELPPNILVDFYLKSGIGLARFGNFRKATELLNQGLAAASEHGLHEFEFRIERIKTGLGECEQELSQHAATLAEPLRSEELREVSRSLVALHA